MSPTSRKAAMSDPLKKKLRKKAKKSQRRALADRLETNGHHSSEKHRGKRKH
jgi:hypothetical protein